MFMTIQEAHVAFDLLVDKVASPRWDPAKKDRFLNFSQDGIIQGRYDDFKNQKDHSFQSVQRVRDELSTLVVGPTILALVSGTTFAKPNNYRHSLLLRTTIDGLLKAAPPMTYDEESVIDDDPFEIPTPEFPRSNEGQAGIRIKFGTTGVLTQVELFYLRNPARIDLSTGQTSEFPGHLHDEWVDFAAKYASGTVENYNRYKFLKQEALEA